MVPLLLFLFCLGLGIVWSAIMLRRAELLRMTRTVRQLRLARERGSHRPRVRAPLIDLTRCMGCTACVQACPEEGVLDMLHGQAAMVQGANCVGHGLCVQSCPSGAIRLDWEELLETGELPALSADFEVRGRPGMYLVGEATGHGLIRNAVHQGRQVARRLAARWEAGNHAPESFDLAVIGAGPGGLACAVEAAQSGLRVALIERDSFGGQIYNYPKSKMILTEALDLPGYGRLEAASYRREELLHIWKQAFAGSTVELWEGRACSGVRPLASGGFEIMGLEAPLQTRWVCLAPGQRGHPRKLGIPGESLPKVHHFLRDAQEVQRQRILVVGGGDSALETALALAQQPGNRVTLAYRGGHFHRPGAALRERLEQAAASEQLRVLKDTQVERIEPENAFLRRAGHERIRLRNDSLYVQAGSHVGKEFLQSCGVPFGGDERSAALSERRQEITRQERRRLLQNLGVALFFSTGAALWCLQHWSYYGLEFSQRPLSELHDLLRPSSPLGLSLGWLALACLLFNLSYLLRRLSTSIGRWLTPRSWFAVHVATGLLILPLALLHGAMHVGDTTGGHGVLVLIILILTGALGRYVYAFLPRTAKGHALAYEDVRRELEGVSAEMRELSDPVGKQIVSIVEELCEGPRWQRGPIGRLLSLGAAPTRYRAAEHKLKQNAEAAGRDSAQVQGLLDLLRRSHDCAQRAARFDDLRALFGTWRHIHVWLALLLGMLLVAHIFDAWKYGEWWPF